MENDMVTYNHKEIEKKWQAYWADNHTFKTGTDADKPDVYKRQSMNFVVA